MKKIIITTALLCFGQAVWAQSSSGIDTSKNLKNEVVTYKFVQQMPVARYDISEYLRKNLKYPSALVGENIGGRVFVRFVVDEKGNITEPEVIISDAHELFEQAAVDAVYKMPRWRPGVHNGKKVRTYYSLPINFKPQKPKSYKKKRH